MPPEYQKELFEEFKKEKGKFKKIADKITQRQPKFYIHVSLENIVFAAIIGIMCIVVVFALGVERGKRFTVAALPQKKDTPPEEEKPYTLQLISYKQKELAEDEVNKLLNKKIDAFIIPSGKWYQVRAGGYSDISEAGKALEGFKKDYKGCFIRKGAR